MSGLHLACCLLLLLAGGGLGPQKTRAQPGKFPPSSSHRGSIVSYCVCTSLCACPTEMDITGHEQPLIYGLSQDITCSVTGMDVASMAWMLVVAGYQVPFVTDSDVSELVLQLLPDPSSSLDGSEFVCCNRNSGGSRGGQRGQWYPLSERKTCMLTF